MSGVVLCLSFRSPSLIKNQYGQKEARGHLSLSLHGLVRAEAKRKKRTDLGSTSACTDQAFHKQFLVRLCAQNTELSLRPHSQTYKRERGL